MPFSDQIQDLRSKEIEVLTKATYLEAFVIFLWFLAPYLVSVGGEGGGRGREGESEGNIKAVSERNGCEGE